MTFLEYLFLIGMPLAGGVLALTFRNLSTASLKLLMSFSGAYLIGITFLSLIPELYHQYSLRIGALILGGFVLQILLDQLSKGLEHGHIHADEPISRWYVWSLMFGLGVHSFLEGIPLSGWEHIAVGSDHSHTPLLFGIAVHKVPAAFALGTVLIFSGAGAVRVMMFVVIYALFSPLGALLTEVFYDANWLSVATSMNMIMAVVIGSFLHISTTILFEAGSKAHTFNVFRLFAILAGAAMAVLTVA